MGMSHSLEVLHCWFSLIRKGNSKRMERDSQRGVNLFPRRSLPIDAKDNAGKLQESDRSSSSMLSVKVIPILISSFDGHSFDGSRLSPVHLRNDYPKSIFWRFPCQIGLLLTPVLSHSWSERSNRSSFDQRCRRDEEIRSIRESHLSMSLPRWNRWRHSIDLPVKAIVNGRFLHVLHRVDHRSLSVSAAVREIVAILSAERRWVKWRSFFSQCWRTLHRWSGAGGEMNWRDTALTLFCSAASKKMSHWTKDQKRRSTSDQRMHDSRHPRQSNSLLHLSFTCIGQHRRHLSRLPNSVQRISTSLTRIEDVHRNLELDVATNTTG